MISNKLMVESTYLELKSRQLELKKKEQGAIYMIEKASGGYSFDSMGHYRLNALLVNPAFENQLSDEDIRFMRKHILDNLRIGDLECAIETSSNLLDRGFGISMRNVEFLFHLTDSSRFFNENEYTQEGEEFCRQVFKRREREVVRAIVDSVKPSTAKRLNLSHNTYEKYECLKSNLESNGLSIDEVRVAYLSGDSLIYITGEEISRTGIHAISFKVKSLPSIVAKNMRVFSKIYTPTQEDLDKLTGKRGVRLRAEDVYEFYEKWLSGILGKNKDIFETIIQDRYSPSSLARISFPSKMDKFNPRELNEIFLDTLLLDESGVAFVTDTNESLKGLVRRFGGVIPDSRVLRHKSESFKGKKDGATIRVVLRDRNPANATEVRIKTIKNELESHLGSSELKSNGIYKDRCREVTRINLEKRRRGDNSRGFEKYREACKRSHILYNVSSDQTGIYY